MLNFEKIYNDYLDFYSEKINQITSPLRAHLNIPLFGYHRIDSKGQYITLTDRPDWAVYYIENKLHVNDPFLKLPSHYSAGVALISNFNEKGKCELTEHWNEKILINEGIVIIEKTRDAAEFFIFGGNMKINDFKKIIVNYQELLFHFALYFKQKAHSILEQQTSEGFKLPESSSSDNRCKLTLDKEKKVTFLNAIGLNLACQQGEKLTNREKECLKLLPYGCVKDIAAKLKLSPRTVEYYLENIKNKCNCSSKKDLLDLFCILNPLGLL